MIEILKNLKNNDCNVNFYLITRNKKDKSDINIFQTKAEKSVGEYIYDIVINQLGEYLNNEDYSKCEYCPITKYDKFTVEYISLGELTKLDDFQHLLFSSQSHMIFKGNLEENQELWISLFVFEFTDGTDIRRIIAFQKIRSNKSLNNKKLFSFNQEKLYKIDNSILSIEERVDCIFMDEINQMFIFNKYYFELMFGFEEKFKAEIQEKLKIFEENDEINSILDLRKFYKKIENNRNHLKKLYKIIKDDKFYLLDEENITKIEKKCNIKIEKEEGVIKLSHDNIRKILAMLNEDYLESILTEDSYLTANKIPPK